MALKKRVYQKGNPLHLVKAAVESVNDIRSSLFLAKQLAIRDIKSQYRQSFLGIIWAIIMPLTTGAVWIFLNLTGTIRLTETGVAYPVFAFAGTLIWSIITASINLPMNSTNAAKSILSKINFPKEALLISGIIKMLFDTFFKVLLLLIFLYVFDVGYSTSLFYFPLALLGTILCGITVGLFIAPFGLIYKDIAKVISLVLRFTMYITPVVYIIPKEGLMKSIMELNPFTPLILTTRDTLVGSDPMHLNYYLILVAVCVPFLFIGLVFYRISIPIIIERINA